MSLEDSIIELNATLKAIHKTLSTAQPAPAAEAPAEKAAPKKETAPVKKADAKKAEAEVKAETPAFEDLVKTISLIIGKDPTHATASAAMKKIGVAKLGELTQEQYAGAYQILQDALNGEEAASPAANSFV